MNAAQAVAFVERALGVRAGPALRLEGGLLNVVWRVPAGAGSVIVKYAPPFVATAPEIALDSGRMDFEAMALSLLAGSLHGVVTPAVRPPALHRYDPALHAMVMEDLGAEPALDDWLIGGGDPRRLAALGAFVAALHTESLGIDGLSARADNAGVQRTRFQVQYDRVEEALVAGGVADAGALGARARALGRALMGPGRCLVMGDLWPRSVLVGPAVLGVIDWEFCHWGRPAQDLGHLAAHLWMLSQRAGVADAGWGGFRDAYLGGARLTAQDRTEIALHFGCEILARTTGAFQGGYLYEGLGADDPELQRAVQRAAAALRDPGSASLGL